MTLMVESLLIFLSSHPRAVLLSTVYGNHLIKNSYPANYASEKEI